MTTIDFSMPDYGTASYSSKSSLIFFLQKQISEFNDLNLANESQLQQMTPIL